MRKVAAQSVMVSLLTVFIGSQSLAQHWSKKPFDASYEVQSAAGKSSLRMLNDGQGRVRNEMSTAAGKMTSIIDAPAKVMYSIMETQRMATKMPYKEAPSVTDEQSAKALNAKSLGVKVIDGHPCHGWQTVNQDSTTESWTGDDIGCVVLSTTKGPSYSSTMRLLKYSAAKPSPSDFSVPAGYKVMEMPATPSIR
ncbi:MAG: DUF4412 domain-containing protein [Candidatus Melainabacteria bacterium]|jgi:hypothetical protein|nr:DUF4412 domain-containing protein [Candidatus Melainabacteria bacterium]